LSLQRFGWVNQLEPVSDTHCNLMTAQIQVVERFVYVDGDAARLDLATAVVRIAVFKLSERPLSDEHLDSRTQPVTVEVTISADDARFTINGAVCVERCTGARISALYIEQRARRRSVAEP